MILSNKITFCVLDVVICSNHFNHSLTILSFFPLILDSGKTMEHAIDDLKKKLKKSGLKEVSSPDGCHFFLFFCPIISRAGTDVDNALKYLDQVKGHLQVWEARLMINRINQISFSHDPINYPLLTALQLLGQSSWWCSIPQLTLRKLY